MTASWRISQATNKERWSLNIHSTMKRWWKASTTSPRSTIQTKAITTTRYTKWKYSSPGWTRNKEKLLILSICRLSSPAIPGPFIWSHSRNHFKKLKPILDWITRGQISCSMWILMILMMMGINDEKKYYGVEKNLRINISAFCRNKFFNYKSAIKKRKYLTDLIIYNFNYYK